MPLKYRDDNQARAAIRKAATDSGINPDRIGVTTFSSGSGDLDDRIRIRFPIGRTDGEHHAEGTYDEILAAIGEFKSFDELFSACEKRGLIWRPKSSGSIRGGSRGT